MIETLQPIAATSDRGITRPFLSVTVLNYNYGHFLPKCLDSILAQTLADFEIILINDCSTDNSLEVIEPYLSDPRIRLVNHTVNRGFVASLIEGCELSTGDYISVISADDYAYDSHAFEIAHRVLRADPEIAMFFSAWHEVDDTGRVRYERHAASADYVLSGIDEFRRLVRASSIMHTGTIARRDAYHLVGGYDTRCRYAIDNNLWLALCAAGKIAYVNQPLYAYRAHNTNMSNTKGSFWYGTYEILLGIDYALSLFDDEDLPDKKKLRRVGYQRALVAVPTHDIFAGRYRRGWLGYWTSFKHYPLLTLAQPRLASLMLRTLLGTNRYATLRDWLSLKHDRVSESKNL